MRNRVWSVSSMQACACVWMCAWLHFLTHALLYQHQHIYRYTSHREQGAIIITTKSLLNRMLCHDVAQFPAQETIICCAVEIFWKCCRKHTKLLSVCPPEPLSNHTHSHTAGQLLLERVHESGDDRAGGALLRYQYSYDPRPIKERQTVAPINRSPFQKCLCSLSTNSWEQLTARVQQFGMHYGWCIMVHNHRWIERRKHFALCFNFSRACLQFHAWTVKLAGSASSKSATLNK